MNLEELPKLLGHPTYIESMDLRISHLLLAGALLAPTASAQVAEVGDQPTFSFGTDSYGSMGRNSEKDYRGRPVLVEYWGTR